MEEKLPIGTIVTLKDNEQLLMIIGYNVYERGNENKKYYEYASCIYPVGIYDLDSAVAFDHNDIGKIIYIGYKFERYDEFVRNLEEVIKKTNH